MKGFWGFGVLGFWAVFWVTEGVFWVTEGVFWVTESVLGYGGYFGLRWIF